MYTIQQNTAEELFIKISGYDIVHELSKENQLLLIESLACADTVINHVLNLLIEGYTDTGFKPNNLNKHRAYFLENIDLIQKELFKSLTKNDRL